MALDSTAALQERIKETSLADLGPTFETLGWTTYSRLALATDWVSGQSEPKLFDEELATPLLGPPPPNIDSEEARAAVQRYKGQRLDLKRIFMEAYTMLAADMRRRVERTDDDAPLVVPTAEREARRQRVQREVGLALDLDLDHNDPSNASHDLVAGMDDRNDLRHIPWDAMTTRSQENLKQTKDPAWKPDAHGVMRCSYVVGNHPKADIKSDLLLKY